MGHIFMKKILLATFCMILATHCLYSEQAIENSTKYANLEGSQVELDLFGNIFFGSGYSTQETLLILGGFQIGSDFIFTLPYTKIYGVSVSPQFVYAPVLINNFSTAGRLESYAFSTMAHFEYGVSFFVHLSYYFSVGLGLYYNQVVQSFLDIDSNSIK